MRRIQAKTIINAVAQVCMDSNYVLPADMQTALNTAAETETSEQGKTIFSQITENLEIAAAEKMPICQDTGITVVFADIGENCRIAGNLTEAVNEGVRRGYRDGYLRKSVVADPLRRSNTGDNTPAIIHCRLTEGNKLTLTIAPKGAGCENMSTVKMLTPANGPEKIKNILIDFISANGTNACPPLVIGIGIGGDFELCALMAKRAMCMRTIGSKHPDPYYADLEHSWLDAVNQTGIGPMGLGGAVTAVGLFIEAAPCHIASLPLAINLNCHVTRHKTVVL